MHSLLHPLIHSIIRSFNILRRIGTLGLFQTRRLMLESRGAHGALCHALHLRAVLALRANDYDVEFDKGLQCID